MPINKSLAKSLNKKYGVKKGEQIYFSMEADKTRQFKKGLKTAVQEHHTLKHYPKK